VHMHRTAVILAISVPNDGSRYILGNKHFFQMDMADYS